MYGLHDDIDKIAKNLKEVRSEIRKLDTRMQAVNKQLTILIVNSPEYKADKEKALFNLGMRNQWLTEAHMWKVDATKEERETCKAFADADGRIHTPFGVIERNWGITLEDLEAWGIKVVMDP